MRSSMRQLVDTVRSERGQMVVELAVCMPVMLVVMVLVVDMMVFLGDCARFDRISGEIVRECAASPSSMQYSSSAKVGDMNEQIAEVMGDKPWLSYEVTCDGGLIGGEAVAAGSVLSFVPQPQRYTCTLSYTPWPLENGVFGVAPRPIEHSRTYVIDPYRSGVLA